MGTNASETLTGLAQSVLAEVVRLQVKPFPLSWEPVCIYALS